MSRRAETDGGANSGGLWKRTKGVRRLGSVVCDWIEEREVVDVVRGGWSKVSDVVVYDDAAMRKATESKVVGGGSIPGNRNLTKTCIIKMGVLRVTFTAH